MGVPSISAFLDNLGEEESLWMLTAGTCCSLTTCMPCG